MVDTVPILFLLKDIGRTTTIRNSVVHNSSIFGDCPIASFCKIRSYYPIYLIN